MNNFLGNFNSIEEVHTTHPLGGVQGDYVTIGTENYYWNPFSLEWTTEKPAAVVPVNSVRETNNIGSFSNIEEVYSKYPNGGNEGDYLFVGNVKYVWNKWEQVWQNKGDTTPVGGRTANTFDGDLIVGNDLYVGGIFRFKGFSSGGGETPQPSPTLSLKDLNEFPITPQQAIDFVKNNNQNAYFTLVDDGKMIGTVSIFIDTQRQVLTEVLETRVLVKGDTIGGGHVYDQPTRYWRNYGLKQDYAQGKIKKHQWTLWEKCTDKKLTHLSEHLTEMVEVYDGSPKGEHHTLKEVLDMITSEVAATQYKKCRLVSFVDNNIHKRVLYQCNAAEVSADENNWKRLLTEDDPIDVKQKPTILPFDDYVDNVSVIIGSPVVSGDIVWDRIKKVFLTLSNGSYYAYVPNSYYYGSATVDGVVPKEGVIFYHRTNGEAYTWKDGKMIPLISAAIKDLKEVADTAKKKANENAEAIRNMVISGGLPIVQEAGTDTAKVMSQAAVAKIISQYDVSASNDGTRYTLQEAINAVPIHFQKGGISIKFVDSTTNEYVEYYNKSDGWNNDIKSWSVVTGNYEKLSKAINTHKEEKSFLWLDKTYYDKDGILRSYDTAGKYSSVEVVLTEYVGKTIHCQYYTPNDDAVRSVIIKKDDTIVPFDNSTSEAKEFIVTNDMKSLRLSNYTQKLENPYVKVEVTVLGVNERLNDIEKSINGYYTEKEISLNWVAGEYYNSAAVPTSYSPISRKQRTSVDISNLPIRSELHILSYSDSSNSYETYSFVLTKGGEYKKLVLSPAKEYVFTIEEPCDSLLLSDDTTMLPAHTPYVKIKEFHSGLKDTVEKKESKQVDLFLFMGQSNMAGRGVVTTEYPEDAPSVIEGAGYEFRAISDPTRLYPITKTLGIAENVTGAINDYSKKTGSLVPSFVNSYYKVTGIPIIAVSASVGGTPSVDFKQDTPIFNDAVNRLELAKKWLRDNGYKISHIYMVWCQGESDGDANVSIKTYKANFENIFSGMKANGVEKCFLIRIGEDNGTDKDYTNIMQAQNQICKESEDVVMVSLDFQSMLSRGLMKDEWHYYQQAYNEVGATAGYHTGVYRMFNREAVMFDQKNNELFYTKWSR